MLDIKDKARPSILQYVKKDAINDTKTWLPLLYSSYFIHFKISIQRYHIVTILC